MDLNFKIIQQIIICNSVKPCHVFGQNKLFHIFHNEGHCILSGRLHALAHHQEVRWLKLVMATRWCLLSVYSACRPGWVCLLATLHPVAETNNTGGEDGGLDPIPFKLFPRNSVRTVAHVAFL